MTVVIGILAILTTLNLVTLFSVLMRFKALERALGIGDSPGGSPIMASGGKCPDFELDHPLNGRVTRAGLMGSTYSLVFISQTCSHCGTIAQTLDAAFVDHESAASTMLVDITGAQASMSAIEFREKLGLSHLHILTSRQPVGSIFEVTATPVFCAVGETGVIEMSGSLDSPEALGFISKNSTDSRAAVSR